MMLNDNMALATLNMQCVNKNMTNMRKKCKIIEIFRKSNSRLDIILLHEYTFLLEEDLEKTQHLDFLKELSL